jgi:tripartite-type tricarboxylate transporter receptor subunit TctC
LRRLGTATAAAFAAPKALLAPTTITSPGSQEVANKACAALSGRRLRWVVPYTAGGGYDVYSRLIAPYLEAELGAEIIVDNVPGASGTVGARTVQGAVPDGSTVGILHAAGLLIASMSGSASAPHPARDFTVLGRIAANHTIWVTSPRSRYRTLDSMAAAEPGAPVILGAVEVSSSNFVAMVVAADLLAIPVEFVTGQPGSRELSLALIRGEVDASSFTLESVLDRIDAGDLVPILQIVPDSGAESGSDLDGVPVLGGPDGLAERWARRRGADAGAARATADTLARLMGLGRIVVAPPRMPPDVARCLEAGLQRALADPELHARAAAARRPLDILSGADVTAMIRAVEDAAAPIVTMVSAAIDRLRG